MTLGTITRTQVHCDATVQAACNVQHPTAPHTCPEVLEVHSVNPETIMTAAYTAGWSYTAGGSAPGMVFQTDGSDRHWCPTHRDQAWPDGCRCTLDPDGTRTTHGCPHHTDQATPPPAEPWTPCWRSECRTACGYNLTACTATARTPR